MHRQRLNGVIGGKRRKFSNIQKMCPRNEVRGRSSSLQSGGSYVQEGGKWGEYNNNKRGGGRISKNPLCVKLKEELSEGQKWSR